MEQVILPLHYAGNIAYYHSILSVRGFSFEIQEHFVKQTYRNRCEILGPNGVQKLVIPTVKTGSRKAMKDVRISYAENWQKLHWKSLEAAYRSSPYFEYYEDKFRPFYTTKIYSLVEFNLNLHEEILAVLGLKKNYTLTEEYIETPEGIDLRSAFPPTNSRNHSHPKYLQVFTDRHPFVNNLSIFDCIFNLGPKALEVL